LGGTEFQMQGRKNPEKVEMSGQKWKPLGSSHGNMRVEIGVLITT